MEIRKTTLLTETLFGETVAEAQMESAIPLPKGKTLERVLSAESEATVSEISCRDGAIVVAGTMTLRPTVESAERLPYAFEAAAEFSHTVRMEGVTPEMTARVSAEIPACSVKREDGGLRMQATVQLRAAVFQPEQIDCITGLDDAKDAETLTLDFSKLEYISSAGLRVLLSAHKIMSAKGGMKVTNVNEIVREVFEVTGFADILTIE
jgi:anti-sigma B factor antagonist